MDNSVILSASDSLSLLENKKLMITKKVEKIKSVFETYSSHPMFYVFVKKFQKKELNKLLKTLPFYELQTKGFFTIVQPYHFVASHLIKSTGKKGFVYFIKAEDTGFIKIGMSKNPDLRLRQIKLSCQKPVLLMKFFVSNSAIMEKKLHEFFKNKRVFGEWFNLNDSDLKKAVNFISCNGGNLYE